MAYSNPRYNGKVGVYRVNEIERFGTVPQNEFGAGEFICIKFTATGTIKVSPASVFYVSGVTWTGTALFADAVVPGNSRILESNTSPILVNAPLVNLSSGNSLFSVNTVSTVPTIGNEYWFVFKVASGCTISLASGSNITYSSTDTYTETLKANSYLSITY